jgi:hypothetical protein
MIEQALLRRFIGSSRRGQDQDDDVHRLAVEARVSDPVPGYGQGRDHAVEALMPDVWNSDTLTDSCGAELIAVNERCTQVRH